MNDPIRLLLIDDNPDDRALVIRELRREFPNAQIEQIIDAQSFEAALQASAFDLIITDYQLLWTDGMAVLRRIKSEWPDCPVIMFTGTGSEEVAVEAMKAGLDDYVLKSPKHYARLSAAAKLALKMSCQRRELKRAEQRYSTLFDTVPIGLFRATPRGEILDANPALIEMLAYPDLESLQRASLAGLFVNPNEYHTWRHLLESDGLVQNYETQWCCSDGRHSWVQCSAKAVRNSATGAVEYEGSLEDISQRKEADCEREALIGELQEALAKVKTLSGLLPICSACKKIRDAKGYWNQIEVYIQGHSDAEFTHSFCPECMKQLYPEIFTEKVRVQ